MTKFEVDLQRWLAIDPTTKWIELDIGTAQRLLAVLEAGLRVRGNVEHSPFCRKDPFCLKDEVDAACSCGAVEFWEACVAALDDPLLAPIAPLVEGKPPEPPTLEDIERERQAALSELKRYEIGVHVSCGNRHNPSEPCPPIK